MISLNIESLSIELQCSYLSIQKKKDNCTLYFNQLILTCMLLKFVRNRKSTIVVMYSLYLYFLGLSLRNTSKVLDIFDGEKRSHIAIWNWIQRFGSLCHIYSKRKRVSAFIIDEIVIQIGSQHFCWLWFSIEPIQSSVLGIYIYLRRKKYTCC